MDNVKIENNEHWADVYVQEDNNTPSENEFKCRHCHYITNKKDNLRKHVNNKHLSPDKINWFKCDYCDYKGKTRQYLNCHLKASHKERIKLYKCTECSFETILEHSFQKHIVDIHSPLESIRGFKCDQCPYISKQKSFVEKHIHYVHKQQTTTEKLYFCGNCEFKSKFLCQVKAHEIAKHAKDEEILWYRCRKCPHQVKIKAYIRDHLKLWHRSENKDDFYSKNGSGTPVVFEEDFCVLKLLTNSGVFYKCGFCSNFYNVSKHKTIFHIKQSHNLVTILNESR